MTHSSRFIICKQNYATSEEVILRSLLKSVLKSCQLYQVTKIVKKFKNLKFQIQRIELNLIYFDKMCFIV